MTQNKCADFPETADIETSSDQYAERFSGSAGEWMLSVQERIALAFIESSNPSSMLDVGGGHGQLAVPICRTGRKVTVIGSAESCKKRISEIVDKEQCKFIIGNVVALPFPDRSFDTVISFRLLTHCKQWPLLIHELCRVAKESVIVDFPTSRSVNKIAPLLFTAKKKIEGDTRTWRLFKHAEVYREFRRNGFTLARKKAQFFLPMVLHRSLKCRTLSALLEGTCRALGLTWLWGSPVIIKMVRQKSRRDAGTLDVEGRRGSQS